MVRYCLVLVVMLMLSNAYADDNKCSIKQSVLVYKDQVAQRGCCSHHGGVCGCDNHSVVCCDNSHSPTCGCHASDVKGLLESHETEIPKS